MGGKAASVTVVSSEIGGAVVLAFAREGAHVVIASRTQEAGQTVVAEIEAMGRSGYLALFGQSLTGRGHCSGCGWWLPGDVTDAVDGQGLP